MMLCVELPDAGWDATAGKRNLVVRLSPPRAVLAIGGLAALVVALLLVFAPPRALGIVPGVVAATVLWYRVRRDPRPQSVAFLGVALYAATAAGLAGGYAP